MRKTVTALRAGAASFAAVFAAGFVLGTLRVLVVEPRLGTLPATLLELPVMLTISWVVCGWALRRWAVPPPTRDRLVMGLTAFVLLIGAETLLGIVGFGRTLAEQGKAFVRPEGLMGLGAQVAFACMPLVRRRRAA
jgi:hypothetical protein